MQQALAPMITATENQTKDLTAELQKLEPQEPIKLESQDGNAIKLESQDGISLLLDHYKDSDKYFAIYKDNGQLKLGDKIIMIDQSANIIIDGHSYKGTSGLWEMIMERIPRVDMIPRKDIDNYKELADRTNLIENPNPHNLTKRSNEYSTKKYQILKGFERKEGYGVVFLPSDVNSLEEKLNLLLAEFNAGNRAETRNQIVAIVDQLQDRSVIGRTEARAINDYLSKCL